MANIGAIRSVGVSLAKYLKDAYDKTVFPPPLTKPKCDFQTISTGELAEDKIPDDKGPHVLILLYRLSVDPYLRSVGRPQNPDMVPPPLSVDLHFLFSFWMESADNELLVVAWTMRQLQMNPVLDSSTLSMEAEWKPEDLVHIIPEELSNEDMMRIWDAVAPSYRLSVSYIARVVRIDPEPIDLREHAPVVATRFGYGIRE